MKTPCCPNLASLLVLAVCGGMILQPCHAAPKKGMENPDFTKGETIPEGADHDWNLGATGARGWMYSERTSTHKARQIAITEVAKGSPADGVLDKGDVILGVSGKPFSYDARTEFGKALTIAESEKGGGRLQVQVWRDGGAREITLTLPVIGTYSPTAPYDCPKSAAILRQGCEALAQRIGSPDYTRNRDHQINSITRSLNALALLASGNDEYRRLIKKEAEWAAEYRSSGFQTWYYGYVISFLAEYVIATGDRSVLPGLRELALETARGQSVVGSWGHGFIDENGLLGGYGMMNAPGLTLTSSLILAKKAGIDDPAIDLAIERNLRMIRYYIGKGTIPYGDHAPWMQNHDSNGKNSMAAVLFEFAGEPEGTKYFSRLSTAAHGAERDYGHTGNFWNMTWALPGVSRSGKQATGAWMEEYGAWAYDLARTWQGNFVHQGPPDMKLDHTPRWDTTGAFLLAYALPLKKLHITGKAMDEDLFISRSDALVLIEIGMGGYGHEKTSYYAALDEEDLLARFDSASPIVRERAAMAVATLKDPPIDALIDKLESDNPHSRIGACQAFLNLGPRGAKAVPALRKALDADDSWLRTNAAYALCAMGDAGMPAVPQMLEIIANSKPTEEDPREMEQRFITIELFQNLLRRQPIDRIDRDLLLRAMEAALDNQDGKARSAVSHIYHKLSPEELEPILPAIRKATEVPAPSGYMFADAVRNRGLLHLAKLKDPAGLDLIFEIMDIDRWGKKNRIDGGIKALEAYGPEASSALPRMRELEKQLSEHREKKMLQPSRERLTKLIRKLEGRKAGKD